MSLALRTNTLRPPVAQPRYAQSASSDPRCAKKLKSPNGPSPKIGHPPQAPDLQDPPSLSTRGNTKNPCKNEPTENPIRTHLPTFRTQIGGSETQIDPTERCRINTTGVLMRRALAFLVEKPSTGPESHKPVHPGRSPIRGLRPDLFAGSSR